MIPCSQLALHFTDYQRSSPLYRQLICQTNHLNCSPSPCSRVSLPHTTTGTPPVYRSSGPHSLNMPIDLPSSHAIRLSIQVWLKLESHSNIMIPCSQLALHFTDYQRSSPLYRQLICQTNHLNCSPSPCSRRFPASHYYGNSIQRQSTGHRGHIPLTSLGEWLPIDLPQFTCRTQTYW